MHIYALGLIILIFTVIHNGSVCGKGDWNTEYLSAEAMGRERGIAAVVIFMHHLSQTLILPAPLNIMGYVGFITVAFFFFCSGYGLMYNVQKNVHYLKTFWARRIQAVMVPYWIVYIGVLLWEKYSGISVGYGDIIWAAVGGRSWFVLSIMLFYLAFYMAFRATRWMKRGINFGLCLSVLLIGIYCAVCIILGVNSWWTASVSGFILGLFWHKVEGFFVEWAKKRYLLHGLIILCTFLFFFGGRLFLMYLGIEYVLLHFMLRNIISALFVGLILFVTLKVRFGGVILSGAGRISYETFLVHTAIIWRLRKVIENDIVFILVLITVTICISALLSIRGKRRENS